jgi:hypothetical protein
MAYFLPYSLLVMARSSQWKWCMKIVRLPDHWARQVAVLALTTLALWPLAAPAALEQTFDVLQVGTATYRKVTVTTKTKSYVFILHSRGMTNLKVADLSSEVQAKLGYQVPEPGGAKTDTTATWARQTISRLESPQLNQFRQGLAGWWSPAQTLAPRIRQSSPNFLLLCAAALVAFYLFHCYCCLCICQKCEGEPGPLIWVPLFQLFPLLEAASMSPWWFLGFLVPGISLVAQVVWCFKITQARGKGVGLALLLIFPLTTPFAILYLAFSGGKPRRNEAPRRIEIMTLETA